jgi:predicted secreted protein
MFRILRLPLAVVVALASLAPIAAAPVSAATTTALFDSIAPGVHHSNDGFGSATVLVPANGYVTYLVRTDSRLHGKRIQIWTDTGTGWKRTSTRTVAADGSIHYFARVTGRIGFWARYGSGASAIASHARLAGVSADGTTTIRVSCEDLGPVGLAAKSIVFRTIGTPVKGTIRVIVCSNPSTGFSWGMASLDSAHLSRVGHSAHPGGRVGGAGTETWSLRLIAGGVGRATLVYSQAWKGGEKAAWTLILTVQSS